MKSKKLSQKNRDEKKYGLLRVSKKTKERIEIIITTLFNTFLIFGELLLYGVIVMWFINTNKDYLMSLDWIWRVGFIIGTISLLIRLMRVKIPMGESE